MQYINAFLRSSRRFEELSSGEESRIGAEDAEKVEDDTLEESDHNTRSEQDVSAEEDDTIEESGNFYTGKDKVTKWEKNIRLRSHNNIKQKYKRNKNKGIQCHNRT